MHYYFQIAIVSAFSIVFPFAATLYRLPGLPKRYIPLVGLFSTGLLNECLSFYMIIRHRNNLLNSNIFTFVEFLLFLWFFYRISNTRMNRFVIAGITALVIWGIDSLLLNTLDGDNTLFRLASYIFIIYLSIDKTNQVIFNGATEAYRRTDLLFCLSLFAYYTYKTFIIIFNVFPMGISDEFYARLWVILSLLNIIINILFTITILWIPKRTEFTLRS